MSVNQEGSMCYDLNKMSKEIYKQNCLVGWWDNPKECIFQKLQLVSTEVAESTEGERKNLMDDHLPHRKMGEVELADALIRVLDLGGRLGIAYTETEVEESWCSEGNSIGMQHLGINKALIMLAIEYEYYYIQGYSSTIEDTYSKLIDSILEVGFNQEYSVLAAVEEKLIYNKNRADHRKENRAKTNGKKF